MTVAPAPATPLAPVHPAVAGFAVAGVILVALDVASPAAAITDTISSHADSAARTAFVIALLASCVGVAATLAGAWRRLVAGRATDMALLTLWPIGIGIASFFDQNEQSWTGMVHNVAVGTAIVGVHLAALRTGSRPLVTLAAGGMATMTALLVLIAMHVAGVPGVPVGVAERVLVVISVALVIGALRARRRSAAHPS